ncbi:MAG: hypothetical protein HYZ53_03895 [Planctomycetes bacterium]|nr:hypothetical protein [Planctomycetota bacterium]
MKFAHALVCVSVLVAALAAFAQDQKPADNQPPANPDFERMKKLTGTWKGTSQMGEDPAAEASVTYKVTSGGTAILETIFAGSDHEMLTVYTVDKGELVLTHYCVMGNQPHMKAGVARDPNVIAFTCVGAGNLASEDDPHMHAGKFTFVDDDHLKTTWTMCKGGKPVHEVKLVLERQKK